MKKTVTKNEYSAFLKSHATRIGNSHIWKVTTPIHGFKKVRTYGDIEGISLSYSPHSAESLIKSGFLHFYRNRRDWVKINAIANLVIPVGAKIHLDLSMPNWDSDFGKIRSNEAIVHSVVRQSDHKPVAFGVSAYDDTFIYSNGQMLGREVKVVPSNGFYNGTGTCDAGIHFYVDVNKALNY